MTHLEPLFLVDAPDSRYDPEGLVPFRGRKVHYDNAGGDRLRRCSESPRS